MENYERYSKFINDWARIRFPARPSEEEMPIFDELMAPFSGKTMLILGATPEFRDIAFKNNVNVTCADLNGDMLEGMKALMQHKDDKDDKEICKEHLVKCNWLSMPFKDESCDAVFAEQSINIIETTRWGRFLKEVKRVLKKNGTFVLKAIVLFEQSEEEILKKWKEQKRDVHYLYDKIGHIPGLYSNNQRGHKDIGEHFDKLLKEGKITKETHNMFFGDYGSICKADVKLNAMSKPEFEALLSKHFTIKQILYGKDLERHSNHPIYVLEK